jgi:glycosyltransferase involved in cell wall biosynthesis
MKNAPLPRKEWLFYCLERFVVPRTDLIIAANPERAAVMQQHYRLSSMPTVVRNIPPLPVRQLTDEQVLDRYPELKKEHPEDIHVVYMGDIDLRRGLSVLLECAALLPARFKLVFVGAGPDLARVRDLASKSIHRRLRVVGSVPHVLVFDVIRQTDVGFVSYPMSGINNILCASNKVFEYAQAGLPMVSTCQPTIKALFDEHPVGRLVGCDGELTSGGVADAIVDLAGRKEYYRENLRRLVASKTWEKEAERLLHAVEEVR